MPDTIFSILSRELGENRQPSHLLFELSGQKLTVQTIAEELEGEVKFWRLELDNGYSRMLSLIERVPDPELKALLKSQASAMYKAADSYAGKLGDTMFDQWAITFLHGLIHRSGLNLRLAESQTR